VQKATQTNLLYNQSY